MMKNIKKYPDLNEYIESIPRELRNIFSPTESEDLENFYLHLKALRIREKERNYVMEIQKNYNLPIRPNYTLKDTMIRVRLKMLKKKIINRRNGYDSRSSDKFPVDPME